MAYRLEVADFGAFYERTYDVAYRTALGIVRDPALAADVTQDSYVAAYRHRDRFRGDAPSGAWLHRIVVNQSLNALRRRRSSPVSADLGPLLVPDEAAGAASRLALLDALDSLRPQQRAAVILRYYHGYDYSTIGQILSTTATNVGVMLSRARDRLRLALETPAAAALEEVARP